MTKYFKALYTTLGIDEPGRAAAVIASHRRQWDFRSVADGPLNVLGSTERNRELAFRMITEETVPVVVRYGEPQELALIDRCLAELRGQEPSRRALRQLQPYTTTLRRCTAVKRPEIAANLEPVIGDLLEWRGDYDNHVGIVLEPEGEDFVL
jgi:CRISPR-associated endonuclease/helicase Cas3